MPNQCFLWAKHMCSNSKGSCQMQGGGREAYFHPGPPGWMLGFRDARALRCASVSPPVQWCPRIRHCTGRGSLRAVTQWPAVCGPDSQEHSPDIRQSIVQAQKSKGTLRSPRGVTGNTGEQKSPGKGEEVWMGQASRVALEGPGCLSPGGRKEVQMSHVVLLLFMATL